MTKDKYELIDVDKIEEQQEDNSKRTRIILAVILAVVILASVLVYFLVFAPSANEKAQIVISEVVTSNSLSYVDDTLGSPDWIELYNASSFDISLKGYGISDVAVLPYRYEFGNVTIKAGEYLVVYATPDRGTEDICIGFGLSKEGESIYLTNPSGEPMQMLSVPELRQDMAWGITDSGEYKYIAQPTPGALNSSITSDTIDGFEWLTETSKVIVNEVMPFESELLPGAAAQYAWVELYNTSGETVNLNDFFLSDNPDNVKKWRFPEVELEANGYMVVYMSGEDSTDGELHTNFSIGNDEHTVYFSDSSVGITMDIGWDENLSDGFSVGLDANGDMKYFSVPTPGSVNNTTAFDSFGYTETDTGLKVNEILLDNAFSILDEDGDRPAWVELYNDSIKTIQLKDYFLSDTDSNYYKWRFPDIELESGQYMVVFLSGKDKTETGLHTNFKIGEDESTLYITNRTDAEQTAFSLDFSVKENISYGRAGEDEWKYFGKPTPGDENSTSSFDEIASARFFDTNGVYINEVSAVGKPKSGDLDWIEIRNGSSGSLNLGGYYLSDSFDEPLKWQIPEMTVSSGGYLVIYASSTPSEQTGKTAPFSISASGETLLLSNSSGVLIDCFDTGVLQTGNSVGRLSGDEMGSRVFFTSSTKGKANADVYYTAYTAQPEFSAPGGYTEKNTVVELTCQEPDAKIYYTTNGDKPTTSSTLYQGGIKITSSMPLRAIAVAPNKLPSLIQTNSYLVEKQHDISVLCISGDQDDINYAYRVSEIFVKREGEAYFEFYEEDGKEGVEFPGAIRVAGAGTRSYAQKSLNIYLRGGYGQSSVTYPFFDNYAITEFKSLSIRNSGQDVGATCLRTAFCEMAVNGMRLDNPQQKPVAVYINGKYWGLYWLCENQNEDFYASRHNLDRDNVEMIKRNQYALSGTKYEILDVRSYARSHNLANEDYYQKFIQWVDEEEIIDYIAAQTFFGNGDMFNQKYWREMNYEVEWRLIFYDLDGALYSKSANYLYSYFNSIGVPSANGSLTNMDIQCALLQNDGWKEQFIERYAYLLNTTLSQDSVLTLFDSMAEMIDSEMQRHVERFNYPRSYSSWQSSVKTARSILAARTDASKRNLQSFFHLSDERMSELFPDGGY